MWRTRGSHPLRVSSTTAPAAAAAAAAAATHPRAALMQRCAYTTLQSQRAGAHAAPQAPSGSTGGASSSCGDCRRRPAASASACAVRLLHSTPRRMGWTDAFMRGVRRIIGGAQQQQPTHAQQSADDSATSTSSTEPQTEPQQHPLADSSTDADVADTQAASGLPASVERTRTLRGANVDTDGDADAGDSTLGTHSASQAAALAGLGPVVTEADEGDPDPDLVSAAEAAEAEAAMARHSSLEEESADDNPVQRVLEEEARRVLDADADEEEDFSTTGEKEDNGKDATMGSDAPSSLTPAAAGHTAAPAAAAAAPARARPGPSVVRFTSWKHQGPSVIRLHRERMYSAAIAQFRALWASVTATGRATLPAPVLESFLSSLAALHQYEAIIDMYASIVAPRRHVVHASPVMLDLLLHACIRHPTLAPLQPLWIALRKIDRRRFQMRTASVLELAAKADSQSSDPSARASATAIAAAVSSAPLQLVLTEKVANQLIQSALLRNEPALALDMWNSIIMGARPRTPAVLADEQSAMLAANAPDAGASSSSAFAAAAASLSVPLPVVYKDRNYRLHSQTAWGLINYLLQRRQYSANQPPPSPTLLINDSAAPATSASSSSSSSSVPLSARSIRPADPSDAHADLFRAFQIYLQTSFIEQLQDVSLLFRILNTTLCAVLSPPPHPHASTSGGASGSGVAPPLHLNRAASKRMRQRNAWLALQIYKFVLHHNESIGRVDAAHRLEGKAMWDPSRAGSVSGGANADSFSLGGGASSKEKDAPWSYTSHRRYIQLDWEAHYRPLMQVCLLYIEADQDDQSATAAASASSSSTSSSVGVGPTGSAPRTAPTFDASLWLDVLLYDVRMSFPDYAHLRSAARRRTGLEMSNREREEVDALEMEEAAQNEELALYVASISRGASSSASSSASAASRPPSAAVQQDYPLPPRTLLPNLPLRPLDEDMFLAIARAMLLQIKRTQTPPLPQQQMAQPQTRSQSQSARSSSPSSPSVPSLSRYVSLYQSIPSLTRFDPVRSAMVSLLLTHLVEQGGGQGQQAAVALSQATVSLLAEVKRLAQVWRHPDVVAKRENERNLAERTAAEEFDVDNETQARERWIAENAQLNALSTAELFDSSSAPALLESIDVHAVSGAGPALTTATAAATALSANICAAHTSAALSFLLRCFSSPSLRHVLTCLHLFDPERWRVMPTPEDYTIIFGQLRHAQSLPHATNIVRALHRTLMMQPASYRTLPCLLAMFDAYASLSGLPDAWQPLPAAAAAAGSAAPSASSPTAATASADGSVGPALVASSAPTAPRYRLARSCSADVVDDVADSMLKLFAYIRRVHIQPLLAPRERPTALHIDHADADASEAHADQPIPLSVPLLLRYMQSYICWRSQHGLLRSGDEVSGANANVESLYERLATLYSSVPGVSHSIREGAAAPAPASEAEHPQSQQQQRLLLQDLPSSAMLVMDESGWTILQADQRDAWVALMRSSTATATAGTEASAGSPVTAPAGENDSSASSSSQPKRSLSLSESAASAEQAERLAAAEGFTTSLRESVYMARRAAAAAARQESARKKRQLAPFAPGHPAHADTATATTATPQAKEDAASSVGSILAAIERSLASVDTQTQATPDAQQDGADAAASREAGRSSPKPAAQAKTKTKAKAAKKEPSTATRAVTPDAAPLTPAPAAASASAAAAPSATPAPKPKPDNPVTLVRSALSEMVGQMDAGDWEGMVRTHAAFQAARTRSGTTAAATPSATGVQNANPTKSGPDVRAMERSIAKMHALAMSKTGSVMLRDVLAPKSKKKNAAQTKPTSAASASAASVSESAPVAAPASVSAAETVPTAEATPAAEAAPVTEAAPAATSEAAAATTPKPVLSSERPDPTDAVSAATAAASSDSTNTDADVFALDKHTLVRQLRQAELRAAELEASLKRERAARIALAQAKGTDADSVVDADASVAPMEYADVLQTQMRPHRRRVETDAEAQVATLAAAADAAGAAPAASSPLSSLMRVMEESATRLRQFGAANDTDALIEARGVRTAFAIEQIGPLLDAAAAAATGSDSHSDPTEVRAARDALHALHRLADSMEREHTSLDAQRSVQSRWPRMQDRFHTTRRTALRLLSQAAGVTNVVDVDPIQEATNATATAAGAPSPSSSSSSPSSPDVSGCSSQVRRQVERVQRLAGHGDWLHLGVEAALIAQRQATLPPSSDADANALAYCASVCAERLARCTRAQLSEIKQLTRVKGSNKMANDASSASLAAAISSKGGASAASTPTSPSDLVSLAAAVGASSNPNPNTRVRLHVARMLDQLRRNAPTQHTEALLWCRRVRSVFSAPLVPLLDDSTRAEVDSLLRLADTVHTKHLSPKAMAAAHTVWNHNRLDSKAAGTRNFLAHYFTQADASESQHAAADNAHETTAGTGDAAGGAGAAAANSRTLPRSQSGAKKPRAHLVAIAKGKSGVGRLKRQQPSLARQQPAVPAAAAAASSTQSSPGRFSLEILDAVLDDVYKEGLAICRQERFAETPHLARSLDTALSDAGVGNHTSLPPATRKKLDSATKLLARMRAEHVRRMRSHRPNNPAP